MTYYSQSEQDQTLASTIFRGLRGGTFLDIGAHDGESLSNSLYFEESRGWRGICIEPDPASFSQLVGRRPAAQCLNVAAGADEGTIRFIQVEGPAQMLSGVEGATDLQRIEGEISDRGGDRRTIDVPMRTISAILAEAGISEVHYASIDVEGYEPEVLRGIDFDAVLVHALTVECNSVASEQPVIAILSQHGFVNCGRRGEDLYFVNYRSPLFGRRKALVRRVKAPPLHRRVMRRLRLILGSLVGRPRV